MKLFDMPYIIECRVNGREHILRVTDIQGKKIQADQLAGELSSVVLIGEQSIQTSSIQLIAPEYVWYEQDKKALSAKGLQRCRNCLEIRSFGDNCPCVKFFDPSKQMPEYLKDYETLSPDRMRAGWIRALKEAKIVTPHWRKYASKIMEKYLIAPEEI